MKLAAVATSEKSESDPVATWTHQSIAETLTNDGIEISSSQVGRILAAINWTLLGLEDG